MACPDRYNDQRIIAEIERRRAMTAGEIQPETQHEEFLHIGSLPEIFQLELDERRILKIQSIDDNVWKIILKPENHDSNKVA